MRGMECGWCGLLGASWYISFTIVPHLRDFGKFIRIYYNKYTHFILLFQLLKHIINLQIIVFFPYCTD